MSKIKAENGFFTLNKLAIVVALACLTSSTYGATLVDAVNQTLQSHPDILSAQSEQNAAAYDIRQAEGGWLPSFDVSAGIGHEYTNNIVTRQVSGSGVNMTRQESQFLIRQLLFDGGNVTNQIRQAKADYGTRTFQVAERRELLGFGAAEAYLNVLRNRELVTIAEFDVKAHEDLYVKVAKRLKAGAGRKSELQLADSRLALSESQLDSARGKLYDADNTYIKSIGSAPATVMELPKPPANVPKSLIDAQRVAMAINPAVHATDEQIAANQAAAGIAQSAYFPTITLDVSAGFNDSLAGVKGYNNNRQEMVRMTYNVFNGGSDKAAVTAAAYRVVVAEDDSANIRRDTNETVALAWNDLQANMNRLPSLQVHVTQSYNVWQAYEKQFQLGQRTLFDLLNAQSEYYDARASLTDAEYDVRIGRYRLLGAMGNFVATMQNTNQNVYRNPYKKVWEPMKQFYGIEQASPQSAAVAGTVNMANRLATGDAYGPVAPNPVDDYKLTPAEAASSPADMTGGKTSKVRAEMAADANSSPFAATAPDAVLPGAAGAGGQAPAAPAVTPTPGTTTQTVPVSIPPAPVTTPPAPAGSPANNNIDSSNFVVPAVVPDASKQPAVAPGGNNQSTAPAPAAQPSKISKWFSWNHSESAMDMANQLAQQRKVQQVVVNKPMVNPAKTLAQNSAIPQKVAIVAPEKVAQKPVIQQKVAVVAPEKLAQKPVIQQKVAIATQAKSPTLNHHTAAALKSTIKPELAATNSVYTLQLLAAREQSTLVQYAHRNHLSAAGHIFKTHNHLGQWYVLTYGQYPTEQKAELAIASLPKPLQKTAPLIKDKSKYQDIKLA